MSGSPDTRVWLAAREPRAPRALLESMDNALATQPAVPSDAAQILAQAALACLTRAIATGDVRAAAFPLLSADSLLTHACEAAAESGEADLDEFCRRFAVQRFAELLKDGT